MMANTKISNNKKLCKELDSIVSLFLDKKTNLNIKNTRDIITGTIDIKILLLIANIEIKHSPFK